MAFSACRRPFESWGYNVSRFLPARPITQRYPCQDRFPFCESAEREPLMVVDPTVEEVSSSIQPWSSDSGFSSRGISCNNKPRSLVYNLRSSITSIDLVVFCLPRKPIKHSSSAYASSLLIYVFYSFHHGGLSAFSRFQGPASHATGHQVCQYYMGYNARYRCSDSMESR
jgi:hypothetical protein